VQNAEANFAPFGLPAEYIDSESEVIHNQPPQQTGVAASLGRGFAAFGLPSEYLTDDCCFEGGA